jgi:diguanylate cyclase (GGDEF)-like protein
VLPEIGSADAAGRLIEKLMVALRQPFAYDGTPLDVSVSLGVSLFPQNGDSAEALTVEADAAMYEAKQAGKNCYRFFGG